MSACKRWRLRPSRAEVLPLRPTVPCSQRLVRKHGDCQRVAKLVRQFPQTLGPLVGERLFALARVLRDRPGNGTVEAPVEGVKLVRRDGRFRLVGQRRDGLADVPVVMDDLGHREAPLSKNLSRVVPRSRPSRR